MIMIMKITMIMIMIMVLMDDKRMEKHIDGGQLF